MKLTKAETARRTSLINQLSELARGGWSHARTEDYEPLEHELAALNRKRNGEAERHG